MTFRERIADWISGGALTFQKNRAEDYRAVMEYLDHLINRIAAEEKPTSNATVKRMARIARGQE